jgi:lipoate-protein ligase B
MTAPLVIRHLHLARTTPFARATAIQDTLVRQNLDFKALTSSPSPASPLPSPPPPTILTFSPTPVYTTGRRELGTLSPATISTLQEPLPEFRGNRGLDNGYANGFSPEVKETLRGGQITFHGPGQLVIYPILDLKAVQSEKWPKGLSAKCFVNVLEEATIKTLAPFGIAGFRTENPGVWISEEKKIAALGLHLRRNITSFGVGLNVRTDLRYFDKIVACGLEGKKTTSIKEVLKERYGRSVEDHLRAISGRKSKREIAMHEAVIDRMKMAEVARSWVKEFRELVWGTRGVVERYTAQGERLERDVARILEGPLPTYKS